MIFIWINPVFQSALPGREALYKKNNDSTNYKFHATTQSSVSE